MSADLPSECWELIFRRLNHHRHFESLSLVSTRFLSITNHLRHTLSISPHIIPLLPRLISRFPNLNSIIIHQSTDHLDPLLITISKSGLHLESLDFSNQTLFPSHSIPALGTAMTHLKILNCSRICGFQDSHLIEIGNAFPFLEDLDISFPQYSFRPSPNRSLDLQSFLGGVSDDGVLDMAKKLTKLSKIDLSGNYFITDKSLIYLSTHCLLLTEIVICDCDFITQSGISVVLRNCGNLNCISLDAIGIPSIDSYFQESFGYAKNLCEIHLSNSFISDEFLCLVAEARIPLGKLSLSHCYNFTSVGLLCLVCRFPNLVYLDVEGANFLTDESVIELSRLLRRLFLINLNSCSKLTSVSLFALLGNCRFLEDIEMERTNLGVEEYSGDLTINPRIKNLKLVGNNSMSDECLEKIGLCCPNLELLDVSYCPTITEEGIIAVLRNCNGVTHLEMNRCMGIKNFEISFELPKLETLHVQGPGVDDETLVVIAKRCQRLLHLNLEGCLNVTAKGVNEVVQNCTRLREINLKWCDNVKEDSFASMVFSRPSLRKIIPPSGHMVTDNQVDFFLRHGCLICKG
ncbi:RNI-like superfamily protein [Euphorbia peplus]|nr:RNI-like superfamily protein [Euphorbia peplus]